jgi:hypothetical protein
MLTKRLITALLGQVAVLSVAIEAVKDDAIQHYCDYQIEHLLRQATLGILQTCNDLSELERLLANQESESNTGTARPAPVAPTPSGDAEMKIQVPRSMLESLDPSQLFASVLLAALANYDKLDEEDESE